MQVEIYLTVIAVRSSVSFPRTSADVGMATHRLSMYRSMESKRSISSDDKVSSHTVLVPVTKAGHLASVSSGPKTVWSHSNPIDSGIGKDEDGMSSAQSASLVSDHETAGNHLQDELFSALIPTHQENRGFFAKDQLSEILTEDRVRKELTGYFEDCLTEATIARHAKTICHGYQNGTSGCNEKSSTKAFIKVLAILIMIDKTRSIIKLMEEDVNDSNLPLIKVPRPSGENLFTLGLKRDPNEVLRCFRRKWNQLNTRNFEEWQWVTLPAEFARPTEDGEVKHNRLEEQRVLPFIKDSRGHNSHFPRRTEGEGGFASIFQVVIHTQHHNFHAARNQTDHAYFAVKKLHSKNELTFKRETELLRSFSSNKHEHLISLLATYEQFDRFFLVFDWAESDLQLYWRKVNPSPSFDLTTVLWMATQCKGIASGIMKIHEHTSMYAKDDGIRAGNKNVVFGHHGNIKPENVLWFAEPGQGNGKVGGTLKLSDFGLAELSVHQTISMGPKSKLGVSLDYRAPEVDLKQGVAIGHSYDIWTLGCLYLEFITWMLGGSKLLDELLEARKARDVMCRNIETLTFFKLEIDSGTGEKTAVIKPAVKQVGLLLSIQSLVRITDINPVHPNTPFSSEMLSVDP